MPARSAGAAATAADNLKAILWMIGAGVAFTVLVVAVRELSDSLPTAEILFIRTAIAVAMLLPWLARAGLGALATRRARAHALRCGSTFTAMMLWFHAVGISSLADSVAIQSTYPLFTILLVTLFLGERPRWLRWAATGVGFLGMLVIVRPGVIPMTPATLMLLGAAVCYAISGTCMKWLADTEPANRSVFFQNASLALLSAIPAAYHWVDPAWSEAPWIAALALSGLAAHMCLVRAVNLGDSSVVMPFDYLRLPFAAVLGFLLYAEVPDAPTVVGGLIIIAAVGSIAATERRG